MSSVALANSLPPNGTLDSEQQQQADIEEKGNGNVMILETGFSLSEKAHNEHETEMEDSQQRFQGRSKEEAISSTPTTFSMDDIRRQILQDIIGGTTATVTSPLELQSPEHPSSISLPLVYCDFTASHRPLRSIEDYLYKQCLPSYGNTHTNTSLTGSQSTAFCAEARQIVGEVCGAKTTGKASEDVVLFAGNGTTSAVELLVDCLGLKHHINLMQEQQQQQEQDQPVIFVGPFEHHSNLLPWRELGKVDIETVRIDSTTGNIDLKHLESLLEEFKHRTVKLGAFSAVSNVTGVVADDIAITALLHQYGALSIWDYATGASYLDVQMNPRHVDYAHEPDLIAKDAVLLSGHKLLGGVGTPGVLIIKKRLVSQQNPPSRSGGGTVFYVTNEHHRFLSNRIERFEGGTPNIVGIWRLGLALTAKLQWKRQIQQVQGTNSSSVVVDYDLQRARRIQHQLMEIPNLVLMDAAYTSSVKLPIYSFLIKCGTRFLHYNYVCALLNDFFGIQSRGGCQCAGPFAQHLLGLHGNMNTAVEECLVHTKDELLRPGFTRLSLPTVGTTEVIERFVIDAIAWVAKNGWKVMHVYRCNHRTGDWRHKSRPSAPLGKKERKWLSHYQIDGSLRQLSEESKPVGVEPPSFSEAFEIANRLLSVVVKDQSSLMQAIKMSQESDTDSSTLATLRWYVYPKDVAAYLNEELDYVPETLDRTAITGAIRPIAWFPIVLKPVETKLRKSAIVEESQKVQFNDPTSATLSNEPKASKGLSELVDAMDISPSIDNLKSEEDKSNWVSFRDGEHTGQAPMEEIEAGVDEGELSSACEVYNVDTDSWERIEISVAEDVTQEQTENKALIESFATRGDVPIVEKNEKKKPSRNATAWGQGTMVQINPPEIGGSEPSVKKAKKQRHKHIKPPAKLMRLVTQAMIQWDMVQEGDRLLLGLSGGKDSLSLLHVMLEFKKKLPINFDIEVCTIDPMTPSFDPSPLIPYVESLGLKYHYIRDDIVDRASSAGKDGKIVSSLCSYCARMKRGHLYSCARKNNCNKLILAQHLDDLAESFMMSVMHNGFLRTMKANYKINAGDLSVVRPLVYCRESLTADFAKQYLKGLVVNENCPACFEEPKERDRIKKLLSKEETLYPNFYDNIKRSILPLMHDDATAILRSYTEEALEKSRKNKKVRPATHTKSGTQTFDKKLESIVKEEEKKESSIADEGLTASSEGLSVFTEDELVLELARRRADRFRLAGAMKRTNTDEDDYDPTGQVCTLNGGNGTIPCRELME